MWINPQDPDILYVSTGIFDRGAIGDKGRKTMSNPFGGLGILKSIDGGQSWKFLNKANGLNFLFIGSLFMHAGKSRHPSSSSRKTIAQKQHKIILRSTAIVHSGCLGRWMKVNAWTQVLKPSQNRGGELLSAVEICLSNPNIVYAGGNSSFYRSNDAASVTHGLRSLVVNLVGGLMAA